MIKNKIMILIGCLISQVYCGSKYPDSINFCLWRKITNVKVSDLNLNFEDECPPYSKTKIKISDLKIQDLEKYSYLKSIINNNEHQWDILINQVISLLRESTKKTTWHLNIYSNYRDHNLNKTEISKDESYINFVDCKIRDLLHLMSILGIIGSNYNREETYRYCMHFLVRNESEIKCIFNVFKNKINELKN